MAQHFDTVASRFRNILKRITAKDPDFDDLCKKHADLTDEIRSLHANTEPMDSARDDALRRRRAALEEQMFAIMSANTRV